jgi:hypothetical protein
MIISANLRIFFVPESVLAHKFYRQFSSDITGGINRWHRRRQGDAHAVGGLQRMLCVGYSE